VAIAGFRRTRRTVGRLRDVLVAIVAHECFLRSATRTWGMNQA
jgi:hypothetical protein